MASYAPPPAEEYLSSDDEFGFTMAQSGSGSFPTISSLSSGSNVGTSAVGDIVVYCNLPFGTVYAKLKYSKSLLSK